MVNIMNLKNQKKLASSVIKGSKKRVRFDQERLTEIKEAITKYDIKALVEDGAITEIPKKGVSRARARKSQVQKRKGRQSGQGNRKGKKTARSPRKELWVKKIRLLRSLLKELKDKHKISTAVFTNLYRKAKGGFFRSKKHLKLYITENKLVDIDGKK